MFTHAVFILNLALFMVTLLWVGNRPTVPKVFAMMAAVCLLHAGCDMWTIHSNGMSMTEWYAETLKTRISASAGLSGSEQEQLAGFVQQLAVLWPSLYAYQAWMLVLVCLGLRWVCNRTFAQSGQWSALSQLDLSIWWVLPLLVGVVLYVASLTVTADLSPILRVACINVLAVSLLPLITQGAASSKGVMNNRGLGAGTQFVIALAGLATGLAVPVLALWGLADFWVNFRKLPRMEVPDGMKER